MKIPLDQIKAAIYRVCKDLEHDCGGGHSCYYEGHSKYDPIRLEHILRAIGDDYEICLWVHDGMFSIHFPDKSDGFSYNPTKSLEEQSKETIAFLYELICK